MFFDEFDAQDSMMCVQSEVFPMTPIALEATMQLRLAREVGLLPALLLI